jgi:hypothetical protein
LKPYFLAVPLGIELVGILTARRLAFVARTETAVGVAVVCGYLLFLILFVPVYLLETIPAVRQVYWGFNHHLAPLLWQVRYETLSLGLLAWFACRKANASPVLRVLIAAACGFFLSYVAQQKGYTYHAFPFRGMTFVGVALLAGMRFSRERHEPRGVTRATVRIGFVMVLLLLLSLVRTSSWYVRYNRLASCRNADENSRAEPQELDRLIALLNESSADSFLALSTHPFPGFPTALYARADWVSRTNSRIFLPAIAKMRAANLPATTPERQFAEEKERAFTLRDLRQRPAVVFVTSRESKHGIGNDPFDILEFYLEEPAFRDEWRDYREVDPIGPNRVFVRSQSCR